jgi:carbamoyl-phosphate synthase large subunit
MIGLSTKAMLGAPVEKIMGSSIDLDRVGVKAAQFSFSRLKGADPTMGVAMASTGEVGCIGADMDEAFLSALRSVGLKLEKRTALISTGPLVRKAEWLPVVRELKGMGYKLYATAGTARYMRSNDVETETLRWPLEKAPPNCLDHIMTGKIGLVINIPKNNEEEELSNDYLIRRTAVDNDVPLITNLKLAQRLLESLKIYDFDDLPVREWDDL